MTWTETHRRTDALREIEEAADRDPSGTLPWREGYDEIFGSPEQLVALLRSRWQARAGVLDDPALTEAQSEELTERLLERSRGLLRLISRADRDERRRTVTLPVQARGVARGVEELEPAS